MKSTKEKSEDLNRLKVMKWKVRSLVLGKRITPKLAIVDTEKMNIMNPNKDDFPELENCLLWVLGIDNRKYSLVSPINTKVLLLFGLY